MFTDVSEERSGSIFKVEERGYMFLRNVGEQIPGHISALNERLVLSE
jgi:hypothetical protein